MNQRIVAMYESLYPPYLNLVRGLAETFDLTLDEIDLKYVEHGFFDQLWSRLLQYEQFYELTRFSSMGSGSQSNCSLVSYYELTWGATSLAETSTAPQTARISWWPRTWRGCTKPWGAPATSCITG